MSYFPELYSHSEIKIKVQLDLSNRIANFDLKGAADIDTSKFAKKADWASIKLNVDRLDLDKLEITQVYLSKISNAIKNDVIKKNIYDDIVKKLCNWFK